MKLFSNIKNALTKKGNIPDWDMSSKESRESQVKTDYEYAKTFRSDQTKKMITYDEYYNNNHYSQQQILALLEKKGINFTPPCLPDAFIQVESQIDSEVPDFQFNGRDDKTDPAKAKEREDVVRYICYANRLEHMNPDNERRLGKLGNAFWKVAFDGSIQGPGITGDIVIGNPSPPNIFNDPSAYDVEDCEFIIYSYRLHRRKARRQFGKIIDELPNDANHGDTEIFRKSDRSVDDDTLQVIEYWYRDEEGDIACSICVNEIEVKFIKKYWDATRHSGNKCYPFVKYCKVPLDQGFWDLSDIESIKDLIDAEDREFLTAILNDAFTANDIILQEENALMDGENITNEPGGVIKVKDNKINAVRRLGGIQSNNGILQMINFIHEKIMETTGSYDSAMGKEPVRVTTASGIAQLNERADFRKGIKKADRMAGFERLYSLIDWTALEFFNQDRIILIRGNQEENEKNQDAIQSGQMQPKPIAFTFNSDQHKQAQPVSRFDKFGQPMPDMFEQDEMGQPLIDEMGQMMPKYVEPKYYYPKMDVEVTAGPGIAKSRAFTLQFTQELTKTPITPQTAPLIKAAIELADLPNKNQLLEDIDSIVASQMPQGLPPDLVDVLQVLPPQLQKQILTQPPQEQVAFLSQPPEKLAQMVQGMGGGGQPMANMGQ